MLFSIVTASIYFTTNSVRGELEYWVFHETVQFSLLLSHVRLFAPQGLQHIRPPCRSATPGVYPNSCPLSWWCYPTISSSVVPFSSCHQSFLASGSFPMSQFIASGGQSIGVSASASIFPMNIQDWFWSWSSNILATWYKEPTHWKRPYSWERLRAWEKGMAEDEMVR